MHSKAGAKSNNIEVLNWISTEHIDMRWQQITGGPGSSMQSMKGSDGTCKAKKSVQRNFDGAKIEHDGRGMEIRQS
jgi:hypothetical protein